MVVARLTQNKAVSSSNLSERYYASIDVVYQECFQDFYVFWVTGKAFQDYNFSSTYN